MQWKTLSDEFSVIDHQLQIEDITAVAQAGFRTIICNRPDKEEEGQPDFSSIAEEAQRIGLDVVYLPVEGRNVNQVIIQEFGQALAGANKPVLGYCRTGTRAAVLWTFFQISQGMTKEDALQISKKAGYDMVSLLN